MLFSGTIAENIAKGKNLSHQPNKFKTLLSLDDSLKLSDEVTHQEISNCCKRSSESVVVGNKDEEMGLSNDDIDEDIIIAAKQSNCHDFIMNFPLQYQTDVGENSMMVSGGQKQVIYMCIIYFDSDLICVFLFS